MANITRFDPLSDLVSFTPFRNLDDFFRVPRMRSLARDLPAEPEIKMDVSEDDKAYHVKAEVPGVKKEDIHVAVEGNQVSITSEVRKEKEEKKGDTVLRSERYYGMQSRSFTLMHDVDQGKAEAKYQDGILELTLPKKSNGGSMKELAIK
jgi:HSP20 family protein